MEDIEFIAAGIERLEEIRPLWEQLNAYHVSLPGYFPELVARITFEQRREELAGKAAEGSVRLDAAVDVRAERPVAYCIATLTSGGLGEIDSLFVEEPYRGRGIADALMRRSLDWLDRKGAAFRKVSVAVGNERVHSFYRRYGFFPITTTLLQKADPPR